MKCMTWLYGFILLCTASLAWGNAPSPVTLVEGENMVAVSLVGRGTGDLTGIFASIDQKALPSWLSLLNVSGAVDLVKGRAGGKKLYLRFSVNSAQPGAEAKIPLVLKDRAGHVWTETVTARVSGAAPVRDVLFENYPNPFNPSTSITFSLKESRQASLVIFNALGQKIRTLLNETRPAGVSAVQWNGKDDSGRPVSSGTYFYRLTSGSFVQTRRMLLVE